MDEPQGDERRLGCFTVLHMIAGCLVVFATVARTHSPSGFAQSFAVIIGVVLGIVYYFAIDIFDWRISQWLLGREQNEGHPLRESEVNRLGFIMVILAMLWCVAGYLLGTVVGRMCSQITIRHT